MDEIKLFLSSTFDKNMHTRRDYFKNEISAHLNNIVGQIGTNLFLYDYEVGIPDKTPFATVLKTCFEKVDDCHYFVAIIDNEYGTIIKKAPKGYKNIPEKYQYLIEKGKREKLSILELEIIRALDDKQKKKIFFINKNIKNRKTKVEKLIQRIESNVDSDNVKYFSRNNVILKYLENYFRNVIINSLDSLSTEQRNLNLMYANKMRYVDNDPILEILNDYVSGDCNKVFVLSGKSGSGKSTLLLNWIQKKYANDCHTKLISCFSDIDGYTVSDLFVRLYQEDNNTQTDSDNKKNDEITILDKFIPFTINQSKKYGKVIIVIDGLDQINFTNERESKYWWLNNILPKNVKVIISTTDENVDKNKFKIHFMSPYCLSQIVEQHLKKEGKELIYPSFVEIFDFENKPMKDIPIIARLICSEICMTANYKKLPALLKKYNKQLSDGKDIIDLYKGFLERVAKRDVMKDNALPEICRYLYCSEYGLNSNTLLNLFSLQGKNRKKQLEYFYTLLYHDLRVNIDGRMKFAHFYFKEAVKELYIKRGINNYRKNIITALEKKKNTEKTIRECAYQINILGYKGKMIEFFSNIDNAEKLYKINSIRFLMFLNKFNIDEKNNMFYKYENIPLKTEYIYFLSLYYSDISNFKKSLIYSEKIISIAEKVFGKEHHKTATFYNDIALVYREQGNFNRSLEYYEKVLNIREKILGNTHPDTAATYNNIALVYEEMGDYSTALEYYEKTLSVFENVFGKEHPNTAIIYNNTAIVYRGKGDYDIALEYYDKALSIRKEVLGKEHPDTATTYNNIAEVYRRQKNYDCALEYNLEALNILKKAFGKEHPSTATAYNNISLIYRAQREYDLALEYIWEALNICEKVLGKEHPLTSTTYHNMARVYHGKNYYDSALEYYEKSLAIDEKFFGRKHPDTATTYNNIAEVYFNKGEYNCALEWYLKSLSVLIKVFGGFKHPYTKTCFRNILLTYEKSCKPEPFKECLRKNLKEQCEKFYV